MTDTSLHSASLAVGSPVVAQIIHEPIQWESLATEWQALFAASPTAAPPLDWDWLWNWWDIYGPVYGARRQGLTILTVRRGSQLVGALPLYQSCQGSAIAGSRCLGFLSTGEAEFEETCPAYMDLLHLPGEEQSCLEAIQRLLVQSRELSWDRVDFCDISEHSPLLSWCNRFPGKYRTNVTPRGRCRIANLSGGFEAYLMSLSPKTRQESRRLLRAVDKAGAVFDMAANAEDASLFLDQMIDLHQERWTKAGKPGCFAAPRFTEFHRRLASLWAPNGKAVLARLGLDGKPLAVIGTFVAGDKCHSYISGTPREGTGAIWSPGIAAHLLLMKHLCERGIIKYDFLKGESVYKQQYGKVEHALTRLCLVRPSLRTMLYSASKLVQRATRKILRSVAGTLPAANQRKLRRIL